MLTFGILYRTNGSFSSSNVALFKYIVVEFYFQTIQYASELN
jgi:hypothetical protein